MRFFIILCLGLFALSAPLFAQITIHSTDFTGPGSSYTSGTAGTATFSCGSAGANQSWTFGPQSISSFTEYNIISPSDAPQHDQFPNATRATHFSNGDTGESYIFDRITPTSYSWLGFVNNDIAQVYTEENLIAPLPATYQTSWTSIRRYIIIFGTDTGIVTDSSTNVVDGWGTVTTPYMSATPCLRVFSHHWNTTRSGGITFINTQNVAYMWVNQHGEPVVNVESVTNVTDPNFSIGSITMMGSPQAASPVRGPVANRFDVAQNYPNPFNPTTTIPLTLDHSARVSLDIYDITGELVSHESSDMPAGSHEFSVNGSRWASGLYFARVTANDQSRVMKMQLLK